MTNPLRAEIGYPKNAFAAIEAVMDACAADERLGWTWLWMLRRNGWENGDVDRRDTLLAMQEGPPAGRGLAERTAQLHLRGLREIGAIKSLGADTLRVVCPADAAQFIAHEPPPSLYSFDHGSKAKAKVGNKGEDKGELRFSFKGSMAQRIAEILNSAEQPRREAVAELIAGVLAAKGDESTSEVVPRRIAEMLLKNWIDAGPEGITGRDALRESLDYLGTAERLITGARQALIACLAHRGFDYRAHYVRAPPRTPK